LLVLLRCLRRHVFRNSQTNLYRFKQISNLNKERGIIDAPLSFNLADLLCHAGLTTIFALLQRVAINPNRL
jgi:hypothetical protein